MKMRILPALLLLALLLPAGAPKAAISHQAVLNWQNPSCTTAKPCSVQVYRAICTAPNGCPSYPNSSFQTPPTAALSVIVNASANMTTWQVTDTDPALADNTTYVYVSTNTYISNANNPGPPSAPWSGTTQSAPSVPPAPLVGSGNNIQ